MAKPKNTSAVGIKGSGGGKGKLNKHPQPKMAKAGEGRTTGRGPC